VQTRPTQVPPSGWWGALLQRAMVCRWVLRRPELRQTASGHGERSRYCALPRARGRPVTWKGIRFRPNASGELRNHKNLWNPLCSYHPAQRLLPGAAAAPPASRPGDLGTWDEGRVCVRDSPALIAHAAVPRDVVGMARPLVSHYFSELHDPLCTGRRGQGAGGRWPPL